MFGKLPRPGTLPGPIVDRVESRLRIAEPPNEASAGERQLELRFVEVAPETIDVIPIQPRPIRTRVAHLRVLGKTITAVMRQWKPGDSGGWGRCKLCPKCHAYGDGCLLIVARHVRREDAPLYSVRGAIGLVFQWPLVE